MYTADQFRPTKHDGVTYKARGDGGMLVMYGWAHVCIFVTGPNELPWASEKTKEKPRWTRTRGNNVLDIGRMRRRIERHESNVRLAAAKGKTVKQPARVKAYSSFLAHIEPAHLNEIRDVPLRAFNYYSAIRRCPGLFELACSGQRRGDLAGGSGIAYALSNIALLAEPRPSRPLDKVRRLIRRKRRDIAIALGFANDVAGVAVHAMEHLCRADLTHGNLQVLRLLLNYRDKLTRKRVAHCDRITGEFLAALEDPSITPALTGSLLDEISQRVHTGAQLTFPVHTLSDTVRMLHARGARIPQVRSIAEVLELHNAEIERQRTTTLDWREGPWPEAPVEEVPGVIEYVASPHELALEGSQMHNCVGSYGPVVTSGEVFIYRTITPERCTLSVALGDDMRFRVRELKLHGNELPKSPRTLRSVEQWLRDKHDATAVERVRAMQEAANTHDRSIPRYALNADWDEADDYADARIPW